jgi:2-oxoisovalerate dehydrogenase E2 component (dihydrolipoyl transacylase)
MANITMPNVGEGVTEGTVTKWLKREGDAVALDEPVVEIETDKAVAELPSPYEGTLTRIIVQEGETVPIGAPLAEISGAAATGIQGDGAAGAATAASPGKRDRLPALKPSASDGASGPGPQRSRRYSPVVAKLAAEHDVDLALVRGTGIEGRVTRQDLLRYIENPVLHSVPPSGDVGVVGVSAGARPAPARPQTPDAPPSAEGESADDEIVPVTPTRRTIATRMLQSHQAVPVAWMAVEADVTALVSLRERAKDEFLRTEGVKLTYMPFFVQAVVAALKQHPSLNATFADDGIRVHRRYHIGVAVAAPSGLVVPVVRDADRKSVSGLARELDDLGEKARARKLSLDDLRGGTFTIDNTGAFGSIISQPIIPPGQAAIMTTEAIRRELRVAADGSFAARSVMNLCISFDHRALDGDHAGLFMRAVREFLEAISPDQAVY